MSASMLRKFITEATKIIALLDESAVGRSTMPPPVRREENETQARWKNLLVDDEQVAQFLKQPAPRSVPSAIKQRFLGHGIVFTYIAGPFLMMFGIFWTAAVFLAEGAPIFFPAIGIAIGIAGIALMIGGSRSRKSKLGLLTNGRGVNATISEGKDTDMLVNDETRWLVTATFYDGKGEFQATHAVYGATGDRLQEMMERGETVSCIYDPQKPSHFVLAVELVSNFNIRL